MARLDRLGTAKEIAQLGRYVGRELSYELLSAFHRQRGDAAARVEQLVEAELLYQRGLPPQATYLFKHALVQETAYQSLLKSKRQQYHQQIAQVLEDGFPRPARPNQNWSRITTPRRPHRAGHSLLAAGGPESHPASANAEAIGHLTTGLELLKSYLTRLNGSARTAHCKSPSGHLHGYQGPSPRK